MNFQQLKYYSVLCDVGSFSKAAECLYISQQGLSMAISNLEAEFSSKFFIRTAKGLVLTEDGEFFRDWANNMLGNLKLCVEHFKGYDEEAGAVKCVGVQGVISEFGADLKERFEILYPGTTVHIREYKDRLCDEIVEREEAEVGFGMEPMDETKFECCRLFRLKLVCVMHESHPWAQYERIPMQELSKEKFIMVDEQFKTADAFIQKCANRGIEITSKLRVGEIIAVHRMVQNNSGVGLTNQAVADTLATPNTVWREFDSDDMYWAIDVFKKKGRILSKHARVFYDYVCHQIAPEA